MTLLRAALPALLLLLALPAARAVDGSAAKAVWYDKLEEAVAASAKSGKPILADFTGSDWCHWCQVLKAEVFDTPEFAAWAAQTVVLLEVDMPMEKPQPPELKKQNEALCEKFDIQGFPTVLILDATLKQVGQLGYVPGGPPAFIATYAAQIKAKAAK
jgi:thiol:disulfide interchange protein